MFEFLELAGFLDFQTGCYTSGKTILKLKGASKFRILIPSETADFLFARFQLDSVCMICMHACLWQDNVMLEMLRAFGVNCDNWVPVQRPSPPGAKTTAAARADAASGVTASACPGDGAAGGAAPPPTAAKSLSGATVGTNPGNDGHPAAAAAASTTPAAEAAAAAVAPSGKDLLSLAVHRKHLQMMSLGCSFGYPLPVLMKALVCYRLQLARERDAEARACDATALEKAEAPRASGYLVTRHGSGLRF